MTIHRRVALLALWIVSWSVGAYALGQSGKQALKSDIQELYSHSANAREQAASRLVAAGPSAIPLLVHVICDQSKPNFDRAWSAAAKVLGELKAEAAAPCLVQLLMVKYPNVGVFKPDETLSRLDPAFAALTQIGEPAVPTIRMYLPNLGPDEAYLALRVLRAINTTSAKEAAEAYIKVLENQIRLSRQVIADFGRP